MDPHNRTVAPLDRSTGSDATNVILIGDATYADGTKRCGQGVGRGGSGDLVKVVDRSKRPDQIIN